jgi:LysM repeat protein
MNKIFGNNCAKGCLIYFVALIALLAVAAMGLDGLRARFGGAQVQGTKPPEYTIQSTGNSPAAATNDQPSTNPGDTTAGGGGVIATPTVVVAAPPPVTVPAQAVTPAPSQAQGGTISGDTGSSFYIVQPGDTLWGITESLNVNLDDLRDVNNLSDDIIYPSQVLYLPAGATSDGNPAPNPITPDTGVTGDQVGMPNTGIIRKP